MVLPPPPGAAQTEAPGGGAWAARRNAGGLEEGGLGSTRRSPPGPTRAAPAARAVCTQPTCDADLASLPSKPETAPGDTSPSSQEIHPPLSVNTAPRADTRQETELAASLMKELVAIHTADPRSLVIKIRTVQGWSVGKEQEAEDIPAWGPSLDGPCAAFRPPPPPAAQAVGRRPQRGCEPGALFLHTAGFLKLEEGASSHAGAGGDQEASESRSSALRDSGCSERSGLGLRSPAGAGPPGPPSEDAPRCRENLQDGDAAPGKARPVQGCGHRGSWARAAVYLPAPSPARFRALF